MTNGIDTLIVVPAALQRAGFKALLQGQGFNVVGETGSVATALAQLEAGLSPQLILVECPELDSDEFEHLKALKSAAANAHIVVLVDGLPANIAQLLCDAGVAGLLKTDIAPEALIGYINLVMLGETVVHQAVGRLSDSGAFGGSFGSVPKEFANLSERELTVISHLATGRSNKEIARLLGIMDGTIKIHVRNVQRPLSFPIPPRMADWVVVVPRIVCSYRDQQALRHSNRNRRWAEMAWPRALGYLRLGRATRLCSHSLPWSPLRSRVRFLSTSLSSLISSFLLFSLHYYLSLFSHLSLFNFFLLLLFFYLF